MRLQERFDLGVGSIITPNANPGTLGASLQTFTNR
jgi:hypothetical protein